MKRDKSFLVLIIIATLVLLVDLAYIAFLVYQLIIDSLGKDFLYGGFWWVSLIVIILNSLQLLVVGIYFACRKTSNASK